MSLWSALDGGVVTAQQAQAIAVRTHTWAIAYTTRWLSHIALRLDYERAMLGEAGGTVADRSGPEKGGAVQCWAASAGGWAYIRKVNKVSVTIEDNWGNGGRNFTRTIPFDKLTAIMTAADVAAARAAGRLIETTDGTGFHLRKPSSPPPGEPANTPSIDAPTAGDATAPAVTATSIDAMRAQLAQGVRVVAQPQLFPTPDALAARMVALADVRPGHAVLEPSAGTAAILRALPCVRPSGFVVAVEIAQTLVSHLEPWADEVVCGDFLAQSPDALGRFDRIIMNPPFGGAQDVANILHARTFLAPGGRLVALCANGPRQADRLRPLVEQCGGVWEDLPAGTFAAQGTGIRVALLSMSAPQ